MELSRTEFRWLLNVFLEILPRLMTGEVSRKIRDNQRVVIAMISENAQGRFIRIGIFGSNSGGPSFASQQEPTVKAGE